MRNLCEQLEVMRCNHVREHKASPTVRVTRRNGDVQTAQLEDVGDDYIELGMTGAPNRQFIDRQAIAEVVFIRQ